MLKGFFRLPRPLHLTIFEYLSSEELYRFCAHPKHDTRLRMLAWQALGLRRDKKVYRYQLDLIKHLATAALKPIPTDEGWAQTLVDFLKDLKPRQSQQGRILSSNLSLTTLDRLRCLLVLKKTSPTTHCDVHNDEQIWCSVPECSVLIKEFSKQDAMHYTEFNSLKILSIIQPSLTRNQKNDLVNILVEKLGEETVTTFFLEDFSVLSCYLTEDQLTQSIGQLFNAFSYAPQASRYIERLSHRLSSKQIHKVLQIHFKILDTLEQLSEQSLYQEKKLQLFNYLASFSVFMNQAQLLKLMHCILSEVMYWVSNNVNLHSLTTYQQIKNDEAPEQKALESFKKLLVYLDTDNTDRLASLIMQQSHNKDQVAFFIATYPYMEILLAKLDLEKRKTYINTLFEAFTLFDPPQMSYPRYELITLCILDYLPAFIPFLNAHQQRNVFSFLLNVIKYSLTLSHPKTELHKALLNSLTALAPYLQHQSDTATLAFFKEALAYVQEWLTSFIECPETVEEFKPIIIAALYCQTAFAYRLSENELKDFYRNQIYAPFFDPQSSITDIALDCFKILRPFLNKDERAFLLQTLNTSLQEQHSVWLGTFMDGIPLLLGACQPREVLKIVKTIQKKINEFSQLCSDKLPPHNACDRAPLTATIRAGLYCLMHLPSNFYMTQYKIQDEINHHIIQNLSSWPQGFPRAYGYQYLTSILHQLTSEEQQKIFTRLIAAFPLDRDDDVFHTAEYCLQYLIQCQKQTNNPDQFKKLLHLLLPLLSKDSRVNNNNPLEGLGTQRSRITALQGFLPLIPQCNQEQLFFAAEMLLQKLHHSEKGIRSISLECFSQLMLYLNFEARERIFAQLSDLCKDPSFSLEAMTAKIYLNVYNSIPVFKLSVGLPNEALSQKQIDLPSPSP